MSCCCACVSVYVLSILGISPRERVLQRDIMVSNINTDWCVQEHSAIRFAIAGSLCSIDVHTVHICFTLLAKYDCNLSEVLFAGDTHVDLLPLVSSSSMWHPAVDVQYYRLLNDDRIIIHLRFISRTLSTIRHRRISLTIRVDVLTKYMSYLGENSDRAVLLGTDGRIAVRNIVGMSTTRRFIAT